ncbi:MAG: hypothetical protein AAGB32_04630, partial [Pseudomonadota bacterium]
FANMRFHLDKSQNVEAALIFNRAHMKMERQYLKPFPAIMSWLYGVFTDYGNSISRPLWYIFIASLVSIFLFLPPNNLELKSNENNTWVEKINDQCIKNNRCFNRASWYSVEPVFNPLGVVVGSNKFSPTNITLVYLNALHRIFLITMLFFFFLALRRRFRISN